MDDTSSWFDKILNTGLEVGKIFSQKGEVERTNKTAGTATNWTPILLIGGGMLAAVLFVGLMFKAAKA